MPDYSEMNVQYRKMQNILSKIDYSKITPLYNFLKNKITHKALSNV